MKTLIRFTVALALVCPAIPCLADVPQLVNVQGLLTDSSDEPVADGTYSVTFELNTSETGTSTLWSESRMVTTEDGLFTIVLGETNPLTEAIFANSELWLAITVAGDSEMTPRQRLTSVPYAMNTPDAGGSGGGWVADGGSVYLGDANDNVGIGTDSPSRKLEVVGDIAGSDSLIGHYLRLGSPSEDAKVRLFGNNTTGAYLEISENYYGGGDIYLRTAPGNIAVGLGQYTGYGGSGFLCVNRHDNVNGIAMFGGAGSQDEPRIMLNGHSQTIDINLAQSGDNAVQLPNSSIGSLELANEPGVGNSATHGIVSLDGTFKTIRSRACTFPTAGYAVAIATCQLATSMDGVNNEFVYLGITDVAGSAADYLYSKMFRNELPAGIHYEMATVHRFFQVSAGTTQFYFQGKSTMEYTDVNVSDLTVLFFPTAYGSVSPAPPHPGETFDYSVPEGSTIEAIIDERVKAETESLRRQYTSDLVTLQEKIEQLQKRVDNK